MKKWKPHYDNNRRYNEKWEKQHTWLTSSENGKDGYCTLCKVNIKPRLSNVIQHEKSRKHQRVSPSTTIIIPSSKIHSINLKAEKNCNRNIDEEDIDWNQVIVEDNEVDSDFKINKSSIKKQLNAITDILLRNEKQEKEDSFSVYGKYVADELRDISNPFTRKSVMHKMHTLLFEAQIEQYNETSHLNEHIMGNNQESEQDETIATTTSSKLHLQVSPPQSVKEHNLMKQINTID